MIIVDICRHAKDNIKEILKRNSDVILIEHCDYCYDLITLCYSENGKIYTKGCHYQIINNKNICDECFVKTNLISESKHKTLYYEDGYLVVKETRKMKKLSLFKYQYSYVNYFDFAIGV